MNLPKCSGVLGTALLFGIFPAEDGLLFFTLCYFFQSNIFNPAALAGRKLFR